ncbi:hypothetical protein J416_12162 [Gracilibacillus halophilus YIM-C55.5]|uniref:Uncharacterized protein n=1 Tax=Gracilibacillus halophilus YIM-C55.5 TaxID=1308866 RepID=N4WA71_9BACI|nr:CBO0543 family protein [Gracilibacillus halophilus]ENH96164.1 hypothetical protein J416_12162 [Gracilibacillus halophilus YIM-C55.5]
MTEKESNLSIQIRSMLEELSQLQVEYWKLTSDFSSWQFWAVIFMLIIPLIILFIAIDKDKMLLLGFYGFNYHVWFAYTNEVGVSLGFWEYPYQPMPYIESFALDASFIPICFMLLYQWSIKYKKNIYLYSILLSALFAFVLKPIMVSGHLFHMFKGVNYFHLFLFYVAFFLLSKLITNLFVWLQHRRG